MPEKVIDGVSTVHSKNDRKNYVPSKIHPNTLFTFTSQLDYLIESLKEKKLFPRYCVEDIKYLRIRDYNYITYPMKCFCDISLHQIDEHLSWYGYYGLSFDKSWGLEKGFQPVQYVNEDSELRKDFTFAFRKALRDNSKNKSSANRALQNYLFHELMYIKPYQGKQYNTSLGKMEKKNFSDECEWRYVANVEKLDKGYFQLKPVKTYYHDELQRISNSLKKIDEIAITFEYDDLKYIVVKDESDANELIESISSFSISQTDKNLLYAKVVVWEKVKGDF